MRAPVRSLLPLALLLVSCTLRDLTPGNTRRDETAIQTVVQLFYQGVANHNTALLNRSTLPAATVLRVGPAGPVVVSTGALLTLNDRRSQLGGARVSRSDIRVDGDVAIDRVVLQVHSRDGHQDLEANDVVALARHGQEWRIAQVTLAPWHGRSTP